MDGLELVDTLKRKFAQSSDRALAERLGITVAGLQLWKRRTCCTPRQVASLISAAYSAGQRDVEANAIRPVVEFFEIDACPTRGDGYKLFDPGRGHPYLNGLYEELSAHHGVYVFFDSRGRALYVGKAKRQSLWKEINLAFNRDRGAVQAVKRVQHPARKQAYKSSDEQTRNISRRLVALHDMASYFSAYDVVDGMIDEVEAMLVRSFANDLLNVRTERFSSQRTR